MTASAVAKPMASAGRGSVRLILQLSRPEMASHSPDFVGDRARSRLGSTDTTAHVSVSSTCGAADVDSFPQAEQGQRLGSGLIQRSLLASPSGLSCRILAIRSASIVLAARVRVRAEGSRISPP